MKAKKHESEIIAADTELKSLFKSDNLFPVVGIGASAGGLDAFRKFLKAIPADSGMAYVLVQHLDPKHESLLPELLQKVTKIPVIEISDDIKVLPDHIYVIPSNKIMVATDGVLLLGPRPAKSKTERHLPIDLFFTSLAEVHQSNAIGVVLSGTASDGTLGLKAIKDYGGITFAQDEASAEYDGMPNSAAQAGVVDFILPPGDIPKKLLEIYSKTLLSDEDLQNVPKQDEDVFKQILSLLRIRKGVDFTYYKQTTIRRRILRRMVINKNEETVDYLKFLRGNNQEQDLLFQDMLIPVTSFFRDKKTFDNLCKEVFPTILQNKIPGEITRIWVAGCSTGQEAYSFAICFKIFLGANFERIQIFGTDLSEPAIAKARTGIYEKSELDSVSPEILQEYFTKNNGGYQINKSIRDMCVFAHHNFLKDPPFGKMDCISCRNVLIYMEPYLQKKALTTFHYALNPKGFLLLGKSETTGGLPELFTTVEKSDKLYTRKDIPGRFMQVASLRSEQILNRPADSIKSESLRIDFQKTADDILLLKYTPAGVVINEAMDIVHFRGNTSNFLEQAPGKPSHNLLMMAKNGLGFELRNILHKAKADKGSVVKENIPLKVNGTLRQISIEAVPLPNTLEPYYLILFHDNNSSDTDGSVTSNRQKVSAKTKKEENNIQIKLLEQELAQAREDMRSITEDQEASNEELQSANEELLSGSEELQSLNEELETSQEELQSTNEELTVLNHELVSLNEQITDARNYAESIVATLYQPLLVLDKNLRVKTANKAFYKTFKVNEQETEGVLIYDLGNRQWNIPELRTLLEEILPQKTQIADYEVTHKFSGIGERVILLSALEITREKKEEKLILLSIEDITERKHAQKKLEESEHRYHTMLMNSPFAFSIMKGKDMIITLANDLMKDFWGKGQEVEGKTFLQVLPELINQPFSAMMYKVYTTGEPNYANEILARLNRNGVLEDRYFNVVYQPHLEVDETISGVITIAHEVTNQVLARKKIEESEERFQAAVAAVKGIVWTNNAKGESEGEQPGWHSLTGQSYEAYQEYGWADAIHPDDAQPTVDAWNEAVRERKNFVSEHRVRLINGNYGYFSAKAIPLLNADGVVREWVGVHIDISERKQSENLLRESESKFRGLIEDAPVATCLFIGRELRIEIANDIMISYWGKERNIMGKTLEDAVPELKGQPFLKILDEVFTTGKMYEAKNTIAQTELNGILTSCYFDFTYKAIHNAVGEVHGIMCMAKDVTDQVLALKRIEESESRFRRMADLMPQKVWTADTDGNYNYFNKCWLDYTGLDFEDLKDYGWKKVIHPEDWAETISRWQKSITTGENFEMEHRFRNTKGIYKWHLSRGLLQKDAYSIREIWIGTSTETHHIKEEEQRKGNFIKMVSHELKTPVTSIKGYVQTLLMMLDDKEEKVPPVQIKSSLIRIDKQILNLTRLISEMLDLTRIEAGNLHLKMEIFDLNNLLIEIRDDILVSQPKYDIELNHDCSASIFADRDRIGQVLINFINNGIKYSPKSNKIEIRIFKTDGDTVSVCVKDFGIGISKNDQQKIFERFYRVDGKNEDTFSGFGIGLFIASTIIEKHQGTILINSEMGKGSEFIFTLNIAQKNN